MNTYAIQTEKLNRNFGDLHAVDQLSMEVPVGVIFGFLGPNGAGKTTTIRLLLGLLEPSGGRAEVLGFETLNQSEQIRQRCGALLEYSGIYERLSAEDNLEFYGRVWRLPAAQRKARIHELLTHMGLWERRKELAGSWSRGMKQKLAVARSLLHRPSLIFLDEPTAGLDPVAAVELRDDLASLATKEGVTIFLTTHNLAEAEKLCAQVGIIRNGKLLACGPLEELRSQAGGPKLEVTGHGFTTELIQKIQTLPDIESVIMQNSSLTISLKKAMDTAPLVSLMVSSGVQVEEVRRGAASLEDAFLALVDEE